LWRRQPTNDEAKQNRAARYFRRFIFHSTILKHIVGGKPIPNRIPAHRTASREWNSPTAQLCALGMHKPRIVRAHHTM